MIVAGAIPKVIVKCIVGLILLGTQPEIYGGRTFGKELPDDNNPRYDRTIIEERTSWIAEPALKELTNRKPITIIKEDPERVIYMGDVHGDMNAFQECLKIANLIDEEGLWSGGKTVLVQLGDIFDRGDDDLAIEEWLYILAEQSKEAGGAVYHLLGNHELLNIMGDHSYASKKSYAPFNDLKPLVNDWIETNRHQLKKMPVWTWPRLAAMIASGPVAQLMAGHSVAMKIGSTLVVHAGLLREHFEPKSCNGVQNGGMYCIEYLNSVTNNYLLNGGKMPQDLIWGRESPVWTRKYSSPDGNPLDSDTENELSEVLKATGATRMVVGHTPQAAGINSAANGKVWRIDTGMTSSIGGPSEVLEILNGETITILTKNSRINAENRSADNGKLPQWF